MFQTMYIILIFIFSVKGALLEEGEPCTVPDTLEAGICISIEQCHYAKIILQLGGNPKFCGFKGKTTLVCCPLYVRDICNNGKRNNYRKCVSFTHCQYAKDLTKTGRNPKFCGYTEDEALTYYLENFNRGSYKGRYCKVPDTEVPGWCKSAEKCHHAKTLLQLGADPKFCGFKGTIPLVCCPLSVRYNCHRGKKNNARKCISFDHCQYAKDLIKTGRNPEFCGYTEKETLVCCPISSGIIGTGLKSREMCSIYSYYRSELYVDRGKKAHLREFPHMVAVGYSSGQGANDISWLCGGTLISHFFVLTAAHCATEGQYGSPKWLRFGDLDLASTTDGAQPETLAITEIYIHPNYTSLNKNNDIALLKVSKELYFSKSVKPACLHTEKYIPVSNLGAAGWGRQGLYGDPSTHLLKVTLKVVDFNTCSKRHKEISDETQICAGDSLGQDTCPGDSGGPLHYIVYSAIEDNLHKSHFVVAGVTSFGRGCGGENSLGVYTRVSAYLDWIEGIVWTGQEFEEKF